MKCFLFLIGICCSGLVAAQELAEEAIIPAEKKQEEMALYIPQRPSLSQLREMYEFGQFSVPEVDVYGENSDGKINMSAIAKAEAYRKRQHQINMNFPSRQLQQIRANVQVFDPTNFNQRTNSDLNFYGRRTPQGGIKNEVYEDIRQPFINPYYGGFYGNRHSNSRRPVFYFTQ